ncbi:hypothetical protein ACER0C_007877 [Sarotherodon galilaeus]
MTIVNSEQCPYSGLSPSFSPSAPPCPGKPVNRQCALLPPLGHKESQCRAEEAEWSSQAAGQTVRAHIPSFKWTAEPGEASGQVRQTQAY